MTETEERVHGPTGEASSSNSCQVSETVLTLARALARLPCPAAITLKKIGDIQVNPDQIAMIDELDQAQAEDIAWFKLARASERAWLGVNLRVCHELIGAILGGASPRLVRPLGSAERGLVAAMLASALSCLGPGHRVTVAGVDGPPSWQGQQVLLTGAIRGEKVLDGRALFIGPLSWLVDGAPRGPMVTSTEESVAEGVLVLARTVLPSADLGSARPGDAVVFDGIPGLDLGGPWPVTLQVGRFQACARLEPDGSLMLESPWQLSAKDYAHWRTSEPTSSEGISTASTAAEVIAELGHISLRGNELVAFSRGAALTLGRRSFDPIALRVEGQLWATGQLIALGEQLGVRIVRLTQVE